MTDYTFYFFSLAICLMLAYSLYTAFSPEKVTYESEIMNRQERDLYDIMNANMQGSNKLPNTVKEGLAEPRGYFEPVSDRMKFRTKGDQKSDEELLALTLSRSETDLEDEIYQIELEKITNSAIYDLGEGLDDSILKKQKTKGKQAYKNSRVSFDDIKEDYLLDNDEDHEPWWACNED